MEDVLAQLEQLNVALTARDESKPVVFSTKDPMQAALLQVRILFSTYHASDILSLSWTFTGYFLSGSGLKLSH